MSHVNWFQRLVSRGRAASAPAARPPVVERAVSTSTPSPSPRVERPAWTVCYNIVTPGSRWVGTGWEFFDDEAAARTRYVQLAAAGCPPTKRPYYSKDDRPHLGAAHEMRGDAVGQA